MTRRMRILALTPLLLLPARLALANGGDSMLDTMDMKGVWHLERGDWQLERPFVGLVAILVLVLNAFMHGFSRLLDAPRRPSLIGLIGVVASCAYIFALIAAFRRLALIAAFRRGEDLSFLEVGCLFSLGLIAQGGWILWRSFTRTGRVTTFALLTVSLDLSALLGLIAAKFSKDFIGACYLLGLAPFVLAQAAKSARRLVDVRRGRRPFVLTDYLTTGVLVLGFAFGIFLLVMNARDRADVPPGPEVVDIPRPVPRLGP